MVRNYRRKSERGLTTEEDMQAAVHQIIVEGKKTAHVAKTMKIPRATLQRYVKKSNEGTLTMYLKPTLHGIVIVTFPPHCSHKLQPLNRSVFGPLKRYFNAASVTGMLKSPRQAHHYLWDCWACMDCLPQSLHTRHHPIWVSCEWVLSLQQLTVSLLVMTSLLQKLLKDPTIQNTLPLSREKRHPLQKRYLLKKRHGLSRRKKHRLKQLQKHHLSTHTNATPLKGPPPQGKAPSLWWTPFIKRRDDHSFFYMVISSIYFTLWSTLFIYIVMTIFYFTSWWAFFILSSDEHHLLYIMMVTLCYTL